MLLNLVCPQVWHAEALVGYLHLEVLGCPGCTMGCHFASTFAGRLTRFARFGQNLRSLRGSGKTWRLRASAQSSPFSIGRGATYLRSFFKRSAWISSWISSCISSNMSAQEEAMLCAYSACRIPRLSTHANNSLGNCLSQYCNSVKTFFKRQSQQGYYGWSMTGYILAAIYM